MQVRANILQGGVWPFIRQPVSGRVWRPTDAYEARRAVETFRWNVSAFVPAQRETTRRVVSAKSSPYRDDVLTRIGCLSYKKPQSFKNRNSALPRSRRFLNFKKKEVPRTLLERKNY